MNMITTDFEFGERLASCPACQSKELVPFIASVDYHYGIEGVFQTDQCCDCKTVFLNPMPSVRDLGNMYDAEYYSYQRPQEKSWLNRIRRRILRYPRLTHVPRFKKPGTMLDVGCGAGQYIMLMRQGGWTVCGSELNEAAAAKGREAGLEIYGGELMDAKFDDKFFDFVRSNHSFEHIPNPGPILREMHRILKEDGKLFIGIPNFDGLMARLFGRYWWYFGLPVHPFNYTEKGIATILERHGFKVDKLIHNSDSAGLLGSIQIWLNARRGKRSSSGWIIESEFMRMPVFYAVKLVDLVRRGDCIEVICSKA